jgi:hypothetical protein
MNDPDYASDAELEGVLCRLRSARPAPVPDGLVKRLQPAPSLPSASRSAVAPSHSADRPGRWGLFVAALFALCAFTEISRNIPPPSSFSPPIPAEAAEKALGNTPDSFLIQHHQELVNAESAGIASAGSDKYQIVKFTILHQAWSNAENQSPRFLAEVTAEEYVALPLEVF